MACKEPVHVLVTGAAGTYRYDSDLTLYSCFGSCLVFSMRSENVCDLVLMFSTTILFVQILSLTSLIRCLVK